MKIPQNLNQFKREPALLIVTGRQEAVLYRAHDGKLDKLDSFRTEKPHYSDREGEFKQRGGGVTITTGSVLEIDDKDIIRDFLQEFSQHIKKIPKFKIAFVFAPGQIKNKLVKALPADWQKKVRETIVGSYYRYHPLKLLEMIARQNEGHTTPGDPEAQKILSKPKQPK